MKITTLFFDLDDTLYPPASGLWDEIRVRIEQYLLDRMHIPRDEIQEVRQSFYNQYGTTLRGLQITRNVDMHEYLAYVHDVPLANYITREPRLRGVLEQIPLRKLIFTNADRNHANRVLDILGLQGIFEDIIDIVDIAPYCKPQPEAYQIALQRAGNPDPRTCLMLDDSPRTLATAQSLGFATVCVGGQAAPTGGCNATIPHLLDLLNVLPAFTGNGDGRDE